jgi:hypothetical protein
VKTPLYYSIRVMSVYNPIVAVTSEKLRGRWHGRYVDDNTPTHGNQSDLRGKFTSLEMAKRCKSDISEINGRYREQSKVINKQLSALYVKEREEIEALIATMEGEDK